MATRWLKVEANTPSKPELRQISRLCQCSRGDAFLAFFEFFAWADEQTDDGVIALITKHDVDEVAGLKGFSDALETVHWADFSEAGMVISNWERHNGKSAKKRMVDAERQRKLRDLRPPSRLQRDKCHGDSVTNVTPPS